MRKPALLTLAIALAACQTPPKAEDSAESAEKPAEEVASAEADAAPAEADAAPAEVPGTEKLAQGRAYAEQNKDELFEVEPLTEEEQRLVDADPATLSPEESKARAFALRKKILQDPESPQAKALKEAANNIVDGTVEPNLDYKEKGQSTVPAE